VIESSIQWVARLMPFAGNARSVTMVTKDTGYWDGVPVAVGLGMVLPCEQARPCYDAHRVDQIIGEPHALVCKVAECWGGNVATKATEVRVAQVICNNNKDIRTTWLVSRCLGYQEIAYGRPDADKQG
jgi:hypothetical protein